MRRSKKTRCGIFLNIAACFTTQRLYCFISLKSFYQKQPLVPVQPAVREML